MSTQKKYCCFKCGYASQKSNILNHFKRKKVCSRSPNCKYSDEDIEYLNKHQFDKKFSGINIAENISIENQNINNITNNHITNNITINFPDKLISFDEDWDLSMVGDKNKMFFTLAQQVYSPLLKMILDNELNNNVIIENQHNQKGLVFKKLNDEKIYEECDIDKIIDDAMCKLNKSLHNMLDNILIDFSKQGDQLFNSRINEQKDFINQKLSEYQNNKETQNKIRNLITDIFVNKKEIAISNQKSFLKDIEISNEY